MESPEEYIDFLILNGAIEASGIDSETGEMMFQFTEKLAEVAPEIFGTMMRELQEDIMFFWSEGFVELSKSIDNPTVNLTSKAFDDAAIANLSYEYQMRLKDLKSMFFR